jgi:hypothetical protein
LAVFADASAVQIFVVVGRPSVAGVVGSGPVVEVADPKPGGRHLSGLPYTDGGFVQTAADAVAEMAGIDVDLVELAGNPLIRLRVVARAAHEETDHASVEFGAQRRPLSYRRGSRAFRSAITSSGR